MIRYAIYIRVSGEEQLQGYSMEAQEREMTAWIARQRGDLAGKLVATYREEGHSARTDDRAAFQVMIADAKIGRFDALLVHKFDRLARNRWDAVAYKTLLRKKLGIRVLSATEPSEETDGALGLLVEGILEVVAHWYSLNLAAETRKGKMEKAREGLWHGAAPTGYCTGRCQDCQAPNGPGYCPHAGEPNRGDGKVLIPHPIVGEAIRLAFQWYSGGQLSDRDVAAKLNEHRFETSDGRVVPFYTRYYGRKDGQGPQGPQPFIKSTVRDILNRPFYAGLIEYYGCDPQTGRRRRQPIIVTQGQHEPLVTMALYQKCQDVRRGRGQAVNGRTVNRRTRVYPLSGLLFCAGCGFRMRSLSMNNGVRYYRCRTRIERKDACDQLTVRADQIEPQVAEPLRRLVLSAELRQRILAYLTRDETLEAIEFQKLGVQAAFDRARELYIAGDIGRDRYERARREYRRQMDALQPEVHLDAEAAQPYLDDFSKLWDAATPLERKGLLGTVFRRVLVQDQEIVALEANAPFDQLLDLDGC